jgi:hypothetical protein
MVTLNPVLTTTPGTFSSYNVGMAETFSWIPIDNNIDRPLFARAGYITNLKDLSISLSASDINIGGVEIIDGSDHNLRATLIPQTAGNALLVTSEDNEQEGTLYSFNNSIGGNLHKGWTVDDTLRPVISIMCNSEDSNKIVDIIEYELASNHADQSMLVYEWYEGQMAFSGAALPQWSTTGDGNIAYRIYQDIYGGNIGNTVTPNSSVMRHSGFIVGKNSEGDEGPVVLRGGSSKNILTLCVKRLDSNTKIDLWFAFTCKVL